MTDSKHVAHSELSDIELRVRTLESILTEKGYIDANAVDAIVETYESRVGPRNGATVVATAWTDDGFASWLREDGTAAIASCGFSGGQGEHVVAVENTPGEHNMVVCTLCSCYPWPVLGLPPVVQHGMVSSVQLEGRRTAWHRAAHATAHGRPILLTADPETPGG
jgi:nitrile hydratase